MAFIPLFKHDVFISYRNAANEAHDRWVDRFCDALRDRLADLVGTVTIWRDDPKILAGENWRKEIGEAIESAAIFLAIVSRTYLDSDVCRFELDTFLERLKEENGKLRRIVPIYKNPPPPGADLPEEVTALQDHRFFETEPPPSARFREFSPGPDEETSKSFWRTFERLAQDLMVQLETLKGQARTQAAGTVFLARVAPELHDAREELRAELQQRGYEVVPEREYLWNAANFRELLARDVARAELCVHLVARTASVDCEAPDRALLQLGAAMDATKRKGARSPLVWLRPAAGTDPSAQPLVTHIQQELANEGVQYCERSLEEFKTQIYDELPAPHPAAAGAAEVAVLVEEGDLGATDPLCAVLVDELEIEPRRLHFAGAVPKDPTALTSALVRCSRAIVFWGAASEEWVGEVLSHAAVARLGRERACVYAAAPVTTEKATFRTNRARLVRETGRASVEELRRLLAGGGPRS